MASKQASKKGGVAPFMAAVNEVGQLAVSSVVAITAVSFPVVVSTFTGLNNLQQAFTARGQQLTALGQQLAAQGQQLAAQGQQLAEIAAAVKDIQVIVVHKMAGDR